MNSIIQKINLDSSKGLRPTPLTFKPHRKLSLAKVAGPSRHLSPSPHPKLVILKKENNNVVKQNRSSSNLN